MKLQYIYSFKIIWKEAVGSGYRWNKTSCRSVIARVFTCVFMTLFSILRNIFDSFIIKDTAN